MGVSGCGKSRIGELLASGLKGRFVDADDLHPPANKAKMSAKIPLTDEDRWPWLDIVRRDAIDTTPPGGTTVLACSALKKSYRTHLMAGAPGVRLLYLKGAFDLIAERLAARRGHFMPPDLLRSQFATLEEPSPEEGCTVSIAAPVDEVVLSCMACLTDSHPSERDPELQR